MYIYIYIYIAGSHPEARQPPQAPREPLDLGGRSDSLPIRPHGRPPVPHLGRRHNPWAEVESKKYAKSGFSDNFDLYFYNFYQNLVNGLDFNRLCAPEHIIQMSNSYFVDPLVKTVF